MVTEPEDFSLHLRERLLMLLQQIECDRAAVPNQPSYSAVFDALQATLHNLDRSQAAEKNLS